MIGTTSLFTETQTAFITDHLKKDRDRPKQCKRNRA